MTRVFAGLALGAAAGLIVLATIVFAGSRRAVPTRSSQPAQLAFDADGQSFFARRFDRADGSFTVQVVDAATGQLLIESRPANSVMRWILAEDAGVVWFFSSDIGNFIFVRREGAWEELHWSPSSDTSASYPIPDTVFAGLSERDRRHLGRFRQPR